MNTINKLALIATILLTASLSSFAQASKIHIDTSVEDFNYETLTGTLKIQSFVENDIADPTVVIKPMDIILVLDASSSMDNNDVTYYPYTKQDSKEYSYNGYGYSTLYYRYEGKYYQVSRGNSDGEYYLRFDIGTTQNHQYRYLTGTGVSTTRPTDITTASATIWTGALYKKGNKVTESRLVVMRKAAANFFDLIKEKSHDVDNRMAIVKFSKAATKVSDLVSIKNNATTLRSSITNLKAASGTGTSKGIDSAAAIISRISSDDLINRDQVMIVFSDGDPDDKETEANKVVKACKPLKVDKGVTIYSIGLLDSKAEDYTKKMMEYLSSNYPNATSTSSKGTRAEGDYYWNDPTGESLNELFESIAEKLEPEKIYIGVETKMQGGTFQSSISLNLPSGTSSIEATTAALTDFSASDSTFTFSSTEEDITDITFDESTLTATGFDYSENWCGLEGSTARGKALILRIPFTFNPTSVNQELELYVSGKTPGLYDEESNKYVLAAAPPVPEFVELIIEKKGLHAGESAIFDLDRAKEGSETADVHVNRIVLTGTSSGGAVSYTVPFLNPDATYKVTERTDWSWTYKSAGTPESNGFIKQTKDMTTVPSGETARLTFENTKYSTGKLPDNAEAIKN